MSQVEGLSEVPQTFRESIHGVLQYSMQLSPFSKSTTSFLGAEGDGFHPNECKRPKGKYVNSQSSDLTDIPSVNTENTHKIIFYTGNTVYSWRIDIVHA